jgi:hypothetical protein
MVDLKKGISAAAKKAAKIEAKAEKIAARTPVDEKPFAQAAEVLKQTAGAGEGAFLAGIEYVVRQGCAITSRHGVLKGGQTVKPEWLSGGVDALRRLVEVTGLVVAKGN